MSKETAEWLNLNTLIGFTDVRGKAWHHKAELQGDESNHYTGAIPTEDVLRRLFAWEALRMDVQISGVVDNYDTGEQDIVEFTDSSRVAIMHSRTQHVFGIFKESFQIHPYDEWLLEKVHSICDDSDLAVASAGLLKAGGQAWCQFETPDTIVTPEGLSFRPFLLAATSLDGSLSSTYQFGAQAVVCHAADTEITDGAWRGKVQDHPSAIGPKFSEGREIQVRGLPFTEKVSEEHRYMAREIKRGLTGKRRNEIASEGYSTGIDKAADWVEAQDLKPVAHEIGFPINSEVVPAPELDSRLPASEMWWLAGYLWGDGHLGQYTAVTFSVANEHTELHERIQKAMRALGWNGKGAQRAGCVQYTLSNEGLHNLMVEFKRVGNSQKTPPVWVESIELDLQRALIQGYYAADGNRNTREGCILVSVSLDGLLSLRRILMRLGIPSSIRNGSDPILRSTIQGRKVNVQPQYSIRFWRNVAQLGYTTRFVGNFSHPYIEDGYMWSRVESVAYWSGDVYPITTETHQYLSDFGLSHNCDNTLSAALGESVNRVKVKHSKNSLNEGKAGNIRALLDIVHKMPEEFAAQVKALAETTVTDAQWSAFLDSHIPVPADKGRGQTVAESKRDAFQTLWTSDERVSPWTGTALGVLQTVNTWTHHLMTLRGGEGMTENQRREQRNSERLVKGGVDDLDRGTMAELTKVLALTS